MISQKKRQNIIQRIKAALRENRNGLRDRVLRKGLVISKPYNESPASILIHRERARLAEACIPKVVFLEEFTLFSKLPLELRRQIWSYTLPGPRIIEVHYASEETKQDLMIRKDTHAPLFRIKQACKESQAAVLWRYKYFPAHTWQLRGLPALSMLLFDYSHDIVHFGRRNATRVFFADSSPQNIQEIRTVGLGIHLLGMGLFFAGTEALPPYLRLPNLRKIIVDVTETDEYAYSTAQTNGATPISYVDLHGTPRDDNGRHVLRAFWKKVLEEPELGHLRGVQVVFARLDDPRFLA